MLDRDKKEINELLEMILDSIQVIQERTSKITCGDDFYCHQIICLRWTECV